MKVILETKKITKKYNRKCVISNLEISIKEGEVYALVGKNGAGKTTIMKMITGMILPDGGSYSVFGEEFDVYIPKAQRNRIGALIEDAGLLLYMSGYENIKAKCLCVGNSDDKYIKELLKTVALDKEGNKRVKDYSLGMKQRLGIALALVSQPDLLVLDEPINGLDPQGIAFIRDLIRKLNEKGVTIIISSHILEELGKVATKYGFIHSGRLVQELSDAELEKRCMESGKSLEEYYFELIGEDNND